MDGESLNQLERQSGIETELEMVNDAQRTLHLRLSHQTCIREMQKVVQDRAVNCVIRGLLPAVECTVRLG